MFLHTGFFHDPNGFVVGMMIVVLGKAVPFRKGVDAQWGWCPLAAWACSDKYLIPALSRIIVFLDRILRLKTHRIPLNK
jgi:hypothetical protein